MSRGLLGRIFQKKDHKGQADHAPEAAAAPPFFFQPAEAGAAHSAHAMAPAAAEQEHDPQQEEELRQPLPSTNLQEFQELRSQLFGSQRGGLGLSASDQYQDVANSLTRVITEMAQGFTPDLEQSRTKVLHMFDHFVKLIEASDAYLSRKSRTPAGRARQDIVRSIKALAERDIVGVRSQIDRMQFLSPQELGALTWAQILQEARATRIELNKGYNDLKFTGGQASRVAIIKEGADTQGKGGFFKLEENFALDANHARHNWETALGMVTLPPDLEKELRGREPKSFDPKEFGAREKPAAQFLSIWNQLNKSYATTEQVLTNQKAMNIGLSGGESINMSRRNVAMSRIADLLGVGNLIARSDTAEVADAQGSRRGNIMEGARGQEASDVGSQIKRQQIERMINEGEDYTQFHQDAAYQAIHSAGSLQKSMSSLQVLDELCGQVDRHAGNYFVQMEEGVPVSVQGIDNDFSFGYNKLGAITYLESKSRDVVRNGQIWIPHMDKGLAQRILALSPSVARYALADLVEPKAIDAFIDRLLDMQKALQAEMKKKDSQVFVENDEGWNRQTARSFMEKRDENMMDAKVERASMASSYYSDFVYRFTDSGWSSKVAKEMRNNMATDQVVELLDSGHFDDISHVIDFLQQHNPSVTRQQMEKYVKAGSLLPRMEGAQGELLLHTALENLGEKLFRAYYKQKQEEKAQRERQVKQQQTRPAIG